LNTYWWLSFRSPGSDLELDQDKLFEFGATGTEEVEEASPSPAAGILLKGFFEDEKSFAAAVESFRHRPGFSSGEEPVEDWDRSWRDRQSPLEVTPSLTVAPPWVDLGPSRPEHVIRLEAKMAFGTGSHESTRIAAFLLEKFPPAGKTVLDIGTGTGILALYAAQLGAREVVALDIDPVVGSNLRENLELNPPPPACRFQPFIGELSALGPKARFDLVICNMIRTELWPFREELRSRLRPGGHFLVSGQRLEDKDHFLEWNKSSPFDIVAEIEMEGWWGFAGALGRGRRGAAL
jgi:ribosomal protein L11 methyltransferase